MKKLILLAAILPINVMAHPGHTEINLTNVIEFMIISTVCAYALQRVLSFAREKLKR